MEHSQLTRQTRSQSHRSPNTRLPTNQDDPNSDRASLASIATETSTVRERRTWQPCPCASDLPNEPKQSTDEDEGNSATGHIVYVPNLRTCLTTEINTFIRVLFDLRAHSMLTDDQLKSWQTRLQQQTKHVAHAFPDRFTRNCLYNFDPETYRDVRKFVHVALAAIQQGTRQTTALIRWQRSLRLRCKMQPLPLGLWRQLIYDCELDDTASSVGFTCNGGTHRRRNRNR